ncbi:HEPN-associated N-terminal domain-containing protein [uncultured Draconibacterium sp.]|uniref:HEPN-associated N-terminal domain-containing protein n=1 Tax=uncultured Draconibacterium sp. TaxID=1573823 RepID=UPI0025F580D8|nr:HEPN-associated N-terminal domain-containing protein [uncultured Draconibacterium sp.]
MDFICSECLDNNKALSKYINDNGFDDTCYYCNNSTKVIQKVEILELIETSIYSEWDAAENVLGRMDGDWVGETFLTSEILRDFMGLGEVEIFQEIDDYLPDNAWCWKDPYGISDSELMIYSWEDFCGHIKYKSRFFFQDEITTSSMQIYPSTATGVLRNVCNEILDLDIITNIPKSTKIFRVRPCAIKDNFKTTEDLGVPPNEAIKYPNRFSPSGIQTFHGANDIDTCLQETNKPEHAIISTWETTTQIKVLDFTEDFHLVKNSEIKYNDFPDILEPERRHLRHTIRFLEALADDFIKPIVHDGREHIDYIPTQVAAEFFRKNLLTFEDDIPIDGIKYYSSKTGGINYVFFYTPENCDTGPHQKLKLIKVKKYNRPV